MPAVALEQAKAATSTSDDRTPRFSTKMLHQLKELPSCYVMSCAVVSYLVGATRMKMLEQA
jgi:hypothetical protein